MTTSRFDRIDRRRFVASSIIGGAAVLTSGQPLRDVTRTSPPARLLAQDDSADVPMNRGNAARTGEMPGPGPGSANGVEVIWTFAIGDTVESSPAVGEEVVYLGRYDGNRYAVLAKDGPEHWRFPTSAGSGSTPQWWPVVVNETGAHGWVEAAKVEPLTSGPVPTATA